MDWNTVQGYSKSALQRVSTFGTKAKDAAVEKTETAVEKTKKAQ